MRALNAMLAAIVTVSVAIAPIITSNAFAEGDYRGGGAPQGRMSDKLNLTPEQKQQIQTINQQYREQLKPLQNSLRQTQKERKTLRSNNASQSELQANSNRIQDLNKQIEQVRSAQAGAVRNVLTPEQLSRVNTSAKSGRQRFGREGGSERNRQRNHQRESSEDKSSEGNGQRRGNRQNYPQSPSVEVES
ncbi:MAG: Spy/CpxP family protein refolding chaperone [Pseudanabaenaceae cyanobacterium]|jgi:Spy/CpxP family protein refolding chaperone